MLDLRCHLPRMRHRRTTCARKAQELGAAAALVHTDHSVAPVAVRPLGDAAQARRRLEDGGGAANVATHVIEPNLTKVRSILIELGDFKAHMMVKDGDGHAQLDAATGFRTRRRRARPAWRLQALGYSVYLINVHMNMELFDWRGVDVNLPRTSASHQMPRGLVASVVSSAFRALWRAPPTKRLIIRRGAFRRAIDAEARVAQASS